MRIDEVDDIRSYIGVAPIIVNAAKDNGLTIERCERYFDIPFQQASASALVEKYILPSVRSKKVESLSLGAMKNYKNQGLILSGYREIQCREYTSAYLWHLLKREFAIIILYDAGVIDDFTHDGGVIFIEHWKGV